MLTSLYVRSKALVCLFALLLGACSTKRTSRVSPPVTSADIPFQSYVFDADKGTQLRLSTGTEIRIEPGTLVNGQGAVVHGQVELKVREFHTAQDIFRAGIPLDTRAGSRERLQSGGMIELRAYAKQEELNIATGRSIGVGLAGFRKTDGYDLWYMEEERDWNKRSSFRTDSNRVKWQTIRSLEDSLKEKAPSKQEDQRIFELVGNTAEAPYLEAYSGVQWRLDDSQSPDLLKTDTRMHWEAVRIRAIDKKKDLYELTFTQYDRYNPAANKGQERKILASPLTSRTDMRKRSKQYEKELAELDRKKKERLEALARAQREADLLQFFQADRMGIWNVDKLMRMEECVPIVVEFDFDRTSPQNGKKLQVIALYDEENAVMTFERAEDDTIYIQRGRSMRLIAILPDNQLAVVPNETIQQGVSTGQSRLVFDTKKYSWGAFLAVPEE